MSRTKSTIEKKRGRPEPLGVSHERDGINFAIFSRHAKRVKLVLELRDNQELIFHEIELDGRKNKTGDIWHIKLSILADGIVYGYCMDGDGSSGHCYDYKKVLIDPYCRKLVPRRWGESSEYGVKPVCCVDNRDFDWGDDQPLQRPLSETVIYELHVRGFTNGDGAGVSFPGTYLGLTEKIPYLVQLGITAVELMPVTEFDETDIFFENPVQKKKLKNFWGYNPVSFFSVKSGYASNPDDAVNEFRAMVKAFHQAGIEVILDMVYNHSGEGGYDGVTSSFRGIDNTIYYLLDEEQNYLNYSGCGNTLNCNHPVMRKLIVDSLRFWVVEMHVDGFRFDLASVLGRDKNGDVLPDPPMIELIAEDPVLRNTKIIAEAWDAAGAYQVGTFSSDSRWAEWNGRFRDDVRGFFCGFQGQVPRLATRLAGSSDLYQTSSRSPMSSINFITSHDGFTLNDLVSYENKHNLVNGENNRDGDNHNISWNSGAEGETCEEDILQLRSRRIKSMLATLLFSQGVPMITAGDERGRTQKGNNNSWCQDNEISWVNWMEKEKSRDILRFCKECIRLRMQHRLFRRKTFFPSGIPGEGSCLVKWQGVKAGIEDWSFQSHHLGLLLNGGIDEVEDDSFFLFFNGSRSVAVNLELPEPSEEKRENGWRKIIDTSLASGGDIVDYADAKSYGFHQLIVVPAQTVMMFQTRRIN